MDETRFQEQSEQRGR